MIDYLEQRLEEENEAETFGGARRTVVAARGRGRAEKHTAQPRTDRRQTEMEEKFGGEPAALSAGRGVFSERTEVAAAHGRRREETFTEEDGLPTGREESVSQEARGEDGEAAWLWEETERAGAAGELLEAIRRTGRSGMAVRGTPGVLTVTLPGPAAQGGWDVDALDQAVQRDARRYDGGFPLY